MTITVIIIIKRNSRKSLVGSQNSQHPDMFSGALETILSGSVLHLWWVACWISHGGNMTNHSINPIGLFDLCVHNSLLHTNKNKPSKDSITEAGTGRVTVRSQNNQHTEMYTDTPNYSKRRIPTFFSCCWTNLSDQGSSEFNCSSLPHLMLHTVSRNYTKIASLMRFYYLIYIIYFQSQSSCCRN